MDNLQKFHSWRKKISVAIILVFSRSGIQYMCKGEISVCKVLVSIKVVLVKNDYFRYLKFEMRRYQKMNQFLYWRSFY